MPSIANSVLMGVCLRLSFPLVGNPSEDEERFWTSQNDIIKDLKQLLRSLNIYGIYYGAGFCGLNTTTDNGGRVIIIE